MKETEIIGMRAMGLKLLGVWLGLIMTIYGQGLTVSGFVDGSVAIPIEEDTELQFSFDCLELDVERVLEEGISFRADIDLYDRGADVEQAFMSFWGISFGKFNAPIGFELLDAPDMHQYSHSLVFDHALPTNLVGIRYDRAFKQGLNLAAYLANGWDINFAHVNSPIAGGRLGYDKGGLNIGLTMIQNDSLEIVTDLDAVITMVENLTVGLEINYDGYKKDEAGGLIMVNYSFPFFGLTLRYDVLGQGATTTVSPSFSIGEGAGMLFEYRGGKDINGDELSAAALEFTFTF